MIKALIFDLGGVIVPFDFKRGYARMEQYCSIPAAEIPKRIGSTDLVVRFESGQVEPRRFVEELCGILGLRMEFEEFRRIWYSIFLPDTLIDDAWLAGLAERYPLVLLSNTNAIHFEMLEEGYPILRHFKRRVLSYQVGAMKPSPIIYEAAIRQAGCRPAECFFTDDIAPYVEGARQSGIDAVQFQNKQQLQRELHARGIEC
jgi:FMN phosphatase YigB (HAD superfamily)